MEQPSLLLNLNTYLSAKLITNEQSILDFNNSDNLIIHQANVR
jgi:hypothetical protein